jgi:hypothetical protein
MFSSPILDTTIGLVFIFLLYSLLATTIRETIASWINLRARMLKNGIIDGMLADTSNDNKVESLWKGIKGYFIEIGRLVYNPPKKEADKKLGDKFYEHPIIKNYGSSRIYPTPSYIPAENFSTVLIDVLKEDFAKKLNEIANYKFNQLSNSASMVSIVQSLQNGSDTNKIKELLEYYEAYYLSNRRAQISNPIIDNDTLQILQLHLRDSIYNIQNFRKKLEAWFNQSMDRVSGWYKRQAQAILLVIGIFIGIIFNVDIIEISVKLSEDKDARDKIVQLAVQASDKYKDDPRVKVAKKEDTLDSASVASNKKIFDEYKTNIDSAKALMNNDINNASNIIALGWFDYGRKKDSAYVLGRYPEEFLELEKSIKKDPSVFSLKDSTIYSTKDSAAIINSKVLDALYQRHWIKLKGGYILSNAFKGRKFLGFVILAFAISLGSPFWFDMLNKLIKLRVSGKKEGTDDDKNTPAAKIQQPVTVNVNNQQTGGEAVG